MEKKGYEIDKTKNGRENSWDKFATQIQCTTQLNSKTAKQQEATEYLLGEMCRIEEHLNKMLAPPTSRKGHNEQTSHE